MEPIIKKAIEGGYNGENIMINGSVLNENTFSSRGIRHPTDVVCDPLFWQALGKACGWKGLGIYKMCLCEKSENREVMEWEMYAFRFYEINITEGWEKAVEYLEEIIN